MTAARHMTAIRPQVTLPAVEDWRNRAECVKHGPGLWDDQPAEGARQKERRETLAKDICAGCHVVAECEALRIKIGATSGIWGGRNETDRLFASKACGDKRGTEVGAARHSRAREVVCDPCRIGRAQARTARRARAAS